jgi:arylsulfatase A-like enzyme
MTEYDISRRTLLVSLLAAAAAAPRATTAKRRTGGPKAPWRPNIVFLLGEGLRWDEFSLCGNPILKTPNMDRIGREGVLFRNAFVVNALCLPSRASFLTGAYSHTTGAATNDENRVPARFAMVSDLLRQNGYQTAFIGKAHIDGALLDRPWDYYFGFKGQANYLHPQIVEGINGQYSEPKVYDGYVDDVLTDKAVEWVNTRGGQPFCLFLWFYAPHAPFYRPRRMLELFNGVRVPVPENFNEDLRGYPGKARAVAEAENKIGTTQVFTDDPRSLEELVKDHYAGVQSNDENVGRILDALSLRGKLDRTAIVLSSDHGFFLGEHTFYDKRLMYEESIRIPLMIRYPQTIAAGTVEEEMVLNIDVPLTLLDIAGIKPAATMQGRSVLPLAQGRKVRGWRKDWLYEYYEYPAYQNVKPHRGVRTERYKYIHFFTDPQEYELYDLQTDPHEDNNLYGKPGFEKLSSQLRNRLEELRRETGDEYVYHPSRTPHFKMELGPPEVPRPYR